MIWACKAAFQTQSVFDVNFVHAHPDNKGHGANMGPISGRQDPGGPHVGPLNFAIWAVKVYKTGTASNRTEKVHGDGNEYLEYFEGWCWVYSVFNIEKFKII